MEQERSRVPPNDNEAEQMIIGACLGNKEVAIASCLDRLKPGDFYVIAHQHIFRAIGEMFGKDLIGPKTVEMHIQRKKVDPVDYGGGDYLWDLMDSGAFGAALDVLIKRVEEMATRRRVIDAARSAIDDAHDMQVEDPGERLLSKAMGITESGGSETCSELGDVAGEVFDEVKAIADGTVAAQAGRVMTGYYDIDQKLNVYPPDMIVVGARPSTGKTALALGVALHVAKEGRVLFFSLEMSKKQIVKRYYALLADVPHDRQASGNVTARDLDRMEKALGQAFNFRLTIDDRSSVTVAQMLATAKRVQARLGEPIACIVVDYLQIVGPEDRRSPREQQVSQISRDLKRLAKAMDCPVWVLAQLNRDAAKNGKPRLNDLRESGSIEADADSVLLLHREDMDDKKPTADVEVIIAKQRNGPCGTVMMRYLAAGTRFECPTHFGQEAPSYV